jgi:uncharacterized membrane protein
MIIWNYFKRKTSMKKIIIIGIILLLVLVSGGACGYIIFALRSKNTSSNLSSIIPQLTQNEEVTAGATYNDESGFSFGYPKGVIVSDVTPDEDIYYSVLALAKGGNQITLTVKDTTAKTADNWAKEELNGATLYGAVTMVGVSAKQYTSADKVYTVAIDQGVLYLIEGPKDDGFWEKTQGLVASTFTFGRSSGSSTSGETIYEEEEVVE